MKLFHFAKDGGQESTVSGYWLIEAKKLFSIVLLRFDNGTREAFHNHAFNSVSWVLKGKLIEHHLNGLNETHTPSLLPVITHQHTFHKVRSVGTTWVLSVRGPWRSTWNEYLPDQDKFITLTHGRTQLH